MLIPTASGFCILIVFKLRKKMSVLYEITLTGTFLFGISGTLAAMRRNLDLFGICFIACVSALGGSTIRDVLTGHYPLVWVQDSSFVMAVLAGVVVALCLRKTLSAWKKIVFVVDTIGIGIFAIISINKCLLLGLSPGVSVLFGIVSTIGGSLLRDIVCNEIPIIFRKELSATAVAIGGLVYILLLKTAFPHYLTTVVAISVIVVARLASRKYNLSLPVIAVNE